MDKGEGQGRGLDSGGDAGEQAEKDDGPEGTFANGEKEEGRSGEEQDGHGEIALAAFSEAVATMDEDEEGWRRRGRVANRIVRQHLRPKTMELSWMGHPDLW